MTSSLSQQVLGCLPSLLSHTYGVIACRTVEALCKRTRQRAHLLQYFTSLREAGQGAGDEYTGPLRYEEMRHQVRRGSRAGCRGLGGAILRLELTIVHGELTGSPTPRAIGYSQAVGVEVW